MFCSCRVNPCHGAANCEARTERASPCGQFAVDRCCATDCTDERCTGVEWSYSSPCSGSGCDSASCHIGSVTCRAQSDRHFNHSKVKESPRNLRRDSWFLVVLLCSDIKRLAYRRVRFSLPSILGTPSMKIKQPASPNKSARPQISAVYEATVGSQEAIVERAKQVRALWQLQRHPGPRFCLQVHSKLFNFHHRRHKSCSVFRSCARTACGLQGAFPKCPSHQGRRVIGITCWKKCSGLRLTSHKRGNGKKLEPAR